MHPLLTATVIWRSSANDWYFFPIFLVVAVAGLAVRYWRFFAQWLNGIRGRQWAMVEAVIDVVTVLEQTEQTRYGERIIGYMATLTYFYRNPDLQTGDYCRMFDDEDEAKAWADSMKGRTLMVHVDPRDPSRSALRKEELNAATFPAQPSA